MSVTTRLQQPAMAEAEGITLDAINASDYASNNLSPDLTPRSDDPGSRDGPPDDTDTLPAAFVRLLMRTCDTSPLRVRTGLKIAMSVTIGAAGFIVACVALWSTISATKDGHKATVLAEWTAKKDYLEFCQAVSKNKRVAY
jgi:hypothetical protein